MAMLRLDNVHTFYGNIPVLKGVSLEVLEGEIVALIGANGAGKSTTLRAISGLVRPREGAIWLGDLRIDRVEPHRLVEMGISQVPEGRRIFPRLTVLENLEMGAFTRRDGTDPGQDLEKVFALFPRLKERLRQKGGSLSGGEQQMLAIGRALMARPRLLLLDEPSLGLAPILVQSIFMTLKDINRQGATILLVEQNAHMALELAQRAYVMETGRIVLEGPSAELRDHPEVRRAYLAVEE